MTRYKCKVDRVISFEFELIANSKEDVEDKIITLDLNEDDAINVVRETESIEELPEIAALFTMPVLPDTTPQKVVDAYNVLAEFINNPVMINTGTFLQPDDVNFGLEEKIRKQSDTTKITQQQYDEIMFTYNKYKDGLLLGVNSTVKLANYLNGLLGLNKSRSIYSKIWCGGVDRESLPKGE